MVRKIDKIYFRNFKCYTEKDIVMNTQYMRLWTIVIALALSVTAPIPPTLFLLVKDLASFELIRKNMSKYISQDKYGDCYRHPIHDFMNNCYQFCLPHGRYISYSAVGFSIIKEFMVIKFLCSQTAKHTLWLLQIPYRSRPPGHSKRTPEVSYEELQI